MREIINELDKLKKELSDELCIIASYDTETEQDDESKEDAWNYIDDAIDSIDWAIECLEEIIDERNIL